MQVSEIMVRPSGGPELYVFETWDQARSVGFRHDGSHPLTPDYRAIFGGRVRFAELYARPLKRVVVGPDVDLERDVDGEGTVRQLLEARQKTFGTEAEWVTL